MSRTDRIVKGIIVMAVAAALLTCGVLYLRMVHAVWFDQQLETLPAVRAHPTDPLARVRLSWELADNARDRDSEAQARIAVRLAPSLPVTHACLAHAYSRRGDYKDAVHEFRLAISTNDVKERTMYERDLNQVLAATCGKPHPLLPDPDKEDISTGEVY